MRLRHWLFDRGDNLAGGIYGTILVTSIVAAADCVHTIWLSLGIVEITMIVFWLAHVYAGRSPGASTAKRSRVAGCDGSRATSGRCSRRRSSPRVALLAGGVGLIGTQPAYWIAIGYGVAALVWWGLLFARKERSGLGRRSRSCW